MAWATPKLSEDPAAFRSGFVAIVGRPNVGKSTLLNRLVGTKIAISSDKPQTTRHAVRGILNDEGLQMVFVDTPGLHKPKKLLGERLNDVAIRTLTDVDAIALILDASEQIGSGDRFVHKHAVEAKRPVICVLNKADRTMPEDLLKQIEVARSLPGCQEVLTTSARKGTGLKDLVSELSAFMPEGPQFYPDSELTDQPLDQVLAELIREKILELTKQEIPHSVAVLVEEIQKRPEGSLTDVFASIFVERDSQKAILIGRGGRMLKEVGTRARKDIEEILGSKVFLDLRVKVSREWQTDERELQRFGYT